MKPLTTPRLHRCTAFASSIVVIATGTHLFTRGDTWLGLALFSLGCTLTVTTTHEATSAYKSLRKAIANGGRADKADSALQLTVKEKK